MVGAMECYGFKIKEHSYSLQIFFEAAIPNLSKRVFCYLCVLINFLPLLDSFCYLNFRQCLPSKPK